jgi:uncharacterized membrane protein YidH (DUF202 family)
MGLGFLVLVSCYILFLVSPKDRCGQGNAILGWVAVSGMATLLIGFLISMRATWGAITCIAILDFALGISLMGGVAAGQRKLGTAVVILMVHGVCTSAASWWSWQLLGSEDAVARAKASEAGRILAGAWVVLVVFGVSAGAFGPENPSLTFQDSTAVNVFVVAAIGVVMGAGYTKYVEAITSYHEKSKSVEPQRPAPTTVTPGYRALAYVLTLGVVARLLSGPRRRRRKP